MDKDNLFVRISYRTEDKTENLSQVENKRSTTIRNGEVNSTKYLIGGGVYNRKGGTVVFKAKNLEEVRQVTSDKPLVKDAFMRYDVLIVPKVV